MNKFLSFAMLIIAATLGLTSCGNNEPETPVHVEFQRVTSICNGFEYFSKLSIDATFPSGKGSVTLPNVTLPNGLSSTFNGLKFLSVSSNTQKLGAGTVTGTLQGSFDEATKFISLRGKVDGNDVKIFSLPINSTLNKGVDYDNTTEKFYSFDISQSAGYIYIHNIKFVESMPAQKCLRINIVSGLSTIKQNPWGYEINIHDEVVPEFLNGTTWVPMETRKIINLKSTINLDEKKFDISFTCFDLNFSDNGTLRL